MYSDRKYLKTKETRVKMYLMGANSENFNRLYPVYLFKFMAINNYFSRGFCGLEIMGEK
jgi:lipid II:glycine glycyltransferase (peptidoglycan interpeptide bridge formation enzyme)